MFEIRFRKHLNSWFLGHFYPSEAQLFPTWRGCRRAASSRGGNPFGHEGSVTAWCTDEHRDTGAMATAGLHLPFPGAAAVLVEVCNRNTEVGLAGAWNTREPWEEQQDKSCCLPKGIKVYPKPSFLLPVQRYPKDVVKMGQCPLCPVSHWRTLHDHSDMHIWCLWECECQRERTKSNCLRILSIKVTSPFCKF